MPLVRVCTRVGQRVFRVLVATTASDEGHLSRRLLASRPVFHRLDAGVRTCPTKRVLQNTGQKLQKVIDGTNTFSANGGEPQLVRDQTAGRPLILSLPCERTVRPPGGRAVTTPKYRGCRSDETETPRRASRSSNITETQAEAVVEPDGEADDLGGERYPR